MDELFSKIDRQGIEGSFCAMTAKRKLTFVICSYPVDGLLMNRLSVIARNRGMGGRRLGRHFNNHVSTIQQLLYQASPEKDVVLRNNYRNQDDMMIGGEISCPNRLVHFTGILGQLTLKRVEK